MDILQCTVHVDIQETHKATSTIVVQGCIPYNSDSPYSLCFDQEYELVCSESGLSSTRRAAACVRKIKLLEITDVENYPVLLEGDRGHEIAGYLVYLPEVTDKKVLELSMKINNIIVVDHKEGVLDTSKCLHSVTLYPTGKEEKCKEIIAANHPVERMKVFLNNDCDTFNKLLFLEVMWHLHRFEASVQHVASENGNVLGHYILEKMKWMRENIGTLDHTIYFLLLVMVFRMFRIKFRKAYKPLIEELPKKITCTIEELSIDVVNIAVNNFIEVLSQPDCKVYFYWRKRDWTTLELIQTACESCMTYRTQRLHSGECCTYQVLFWGMLAQKFYTVKPSDSAKWKPGTEYWNTHYVVKMKDRVLDTHVLEQIKKGNELGSKLGLSKLLVNDDILLKLIQRPNSPLTLEAMREIITSKDDPSIVYLTSQAGRGIEKELMSMTEECAMDIVDQVIDLLPPLYSKETEACEAECCWWLDFLHRFSIKNKLSKNEIINKVSCVAKNNSLSDSSECLFFTMQRLFDGIDASNCLYGLLEILNFSQSGDTLNETGDASSGAALFVVFTIFESSDSLYMNQQYLFTKSKEQCKLSLELRTILLVQLNPQESLQEIISIEPTSFQVAGYFVCTVEERRKEVIDYSLKHKLNVIVLICDQESFTDHCEKVFSYFSLYAQVHVLLKIHPHSNFPKAREIVPNHPAHRIKLLLVEHQNAAMTFKSCIEVMWHLHKLEMNDSEVKMDDPQVKALLNYFFNNNENECYIREFLIRLTLLFRLSRISVSNQDDAIKRSLETQSMSMAFLLVGKNPKESANCVLNFLPRILSETLDRSFWSGYTLKSMLEACLHVLKYKCQSLRKYGTDGHFYSVLNWGMIVLKIQSCLEPFGHLLVQQGPKFWEEYLLKNTKESLSPKEISHLETSLFFGQELELDEASLIGAECLLALLERSNYKFDLIEQIVGKMKLLKQPHVRAILSIACDYHRKNKDCRQSYMEEDIDMVISLLSAIKERFQDRVTELDAVLEWFEFLIFISSYEGFNYNFLKKIAHFSSTFPQSITTVIQPKILCATAQRIELIPFTTICDMCTDPNFPLSDDIKVVEEYFQKSQDKHLPMLSDDRWQKLLETIVSRHPRERHVKLFITIVQRFKEYFLTKPRNTRSQWETFIKNLLELNVPGLLSNVSEDQSRELSLLLEIICCEPSKNCLMEICVNLSPASVLGPLQRMLLESIKKALEKGEVTIKHSWIPNILEKSINFVQDQCTKELSSTQLLKECGCWLIIDFVSGRIPIRMRNFESLVPTNLSYITKLGKLSVILRELRKQIEYPSFENFVQDMHKFVKDWMKCIESRSFTYQLIKYLIQYERQFNEILDAYGYPRFTEDLQHLRKIFKKRFFDMKKTLAIEAKDKMYDLEVILLKHNVQLPRLFDEASQIQMPKFQHVKEKGFYKNSSLTFANVDLLTTKMELFFKPMLKHWELWAVYAISMLFRSYFGCFYSQLVKELSEIEALGKALHNTADLLTRMLTSDVITLREVSIEGSLTLDNIDQNLQPDLHLITESLGMDDESIPPERIDGLIAMIKLVQMTDFMFIVCEVCHKFKLVGCIDDPYFKRLQEIADMMKKQPEKKYKMEPATALKNKKFVMQQLSPCKQHLFSLFEQLSLSREFYSLIREKFYEGVVASDVEKNISVTRSFRQTLEVITQQLQHEEYEEQVLNHLYPAFLFVLPFMDQNQDFETLMQNVSQLESPSGFLELKNVRQNMNQIKQWFQQTEGEFVFSNVYDELEQVLNTGEYHFHLTSRVEANLNLKFYPKGQAETHENVVEWDEEKICAFEQKLSLMDDREGMQEKISTLLAWNEVARRFLSALLNLYKFGYTELERLGSPLRLNEDLIEAEAKVLSCEKEVDSWAASIHVTYQEYQPLLFFGVVKLFNLYALLDPKPYSPENMKKIAKEVMFLFRNENDVWKALCDDQVKMALSRIRGATNPVQIVGCFLNGLCFSTPLSDYVFPKRFQNCHAAGVKLFVAHDFSQEKLIRLIISLAGGIPESFDILHCSINTTMDDLKLFLGRMRMKKLRRTFFVLEVNALSYHLQEHLLSEQYNQLESQLIFIETHPSLLREVSGVVIQDCLEMKNLLPPREVANLCKEVQASSPNSAQVILVYGISGVGKTHYIQKELKKMKTSVVITLNETFSIANTISKLNELEIDSEQCGIFFNYTMSPPGDAVSEAEKSGYKSLSEKIGWFFFHLILLGHVEDEQSGASFHSPIGCGWKIFIEVPSRGDAKSSIDYFYKSLAPALSFVGEVFHVKSDVPYDMDKDVMLVSKYLLAFKSGRINAIYMEDDDNSENDDDTVNETTYDCTLHGVDFFDDLPFELVTKIHQLVEAGQIKNFVVRDKPIKFSEDEDPSAEMCWAILYENMPAHVKISKVAQTFFIRYMARRCRFLENFPGFVYNNGLSYCSHRAISGGASVSYINTILLGQTVVQTMLDEASEVCLKSTGNWSSQTHQQLIYDIKDGGGAISLIALKPDKINSHTISSYKDLGINTPQESELHERSTLENYLCCALYEDSHADTVKGCHQTLRDASYVLTLDFLLKMLKIHDRRMCGVPVLIEGETGVGKTALVEMLSLLWNHAWKQQWISVQQDLTDQLTRVFKKLEDSASGYSLHLAGNLNDEAYIEKIVEVLTPTNLQMTSDSYEKDNESKGQPLKLTIESLLLKFHLDPILPLLRVRSSCSLKLENEGNINPKRLLDLHSKLRKSDLDAKGLAELLFLLLQSESASLFHKLNIHAALKYGEINRFLKPVFQQAEDLKKAFPSGVVTLYLDEVNTSTCSGVFKEIIIDRCLDGVPFPENIFVIAACNPHRSNSLASRHSSNDDISTKNSYYVRELHPTMELMKWDFGALDDHQERLYVFAKLQMMQKTFSDKKIEDLDISGLAELVVKNHMFMRECAKARLVDAGYSLQEADIRSKSCVSQRDIQRLFIFYEYLMKFYAITDRLQLDSCQFTGSATKIHRRAILVSLGLVYYMRLSVKDRQKYVHWMEEDSTFDISLKFGDVIKEELDWHANNVELPVGIAKTEALKENIMSIIICSVTGVPLIIEGAPGTSKTVSFSIAVGNVKGKESLKPIFKDTRLFPCLDPYFYQCSRRTTSEEVETVFKRAINRQLGHNKRQKDELSFKCVVFMDEAGLPEKAHESLKVLHYYLEHPIVSFVAITNHPLDAAKSNRAVCIYRPEVFKNDVVILATDCLGLSGDESASTCQTVKHLCNAYASLMKMTNYNNFYGLRDFVYFLAYLRRNCQREHYTASSIINGLQRNFGGLSFEEFLKVCSMFLNQDALDHKCLKTCVQLLNESFKEVCLSDESEFQTSVQSDVRYKLLIDPSEDDSLTRILFTFDVISDKKSRVRKYVCSDLAGSSYSEVHTIAKVRHSATEGHTIVMFQTDNIHECFYDLFNQRFRCITVQGQMRFYANITKGTFSKLSRVSPEFQCVIIIKKSELSATPNAFLNRFEKYYLTYEDLFKIALNYLPPCLRIIIQDAFNKAKEFANTVEGNKSLYGYDKENDTTLMSLLLTLLPTERPKNFLEAVKIESKEELENKDTLVLLLECILIVLTKLGFNFYQSPEEIMSDTVAIQSILVEDEQFKRLMSSRTQEQIWPPIREAFEMLFTASDPSDSQYKEHKFEMYPDACLIISFLQQWLVRYLCKRLMQIMTPEGLAVHYRKLPSTYRRVYLNQQEHFSLKKLITRYLSSVGEKGFATKLMCFTRLSQMISQGFPSLYNGEQRSKDQFYDRVKFLFYDDPKEIVICKVTTNLSQSYIEKLIKDFLSSNVSKVMVFTAAFHGSQPKIKKIINHIRIMIEEEERGFISAKLFVVLIHFLPIILSSSCYPSLYLHGWDHYYLDSICETHGFGLSDLHTPTIQIKDWFLRFCLKGSDCNGADHLIESLEKMLTFSYPIIVSRATFGQDSSVCFNKPMDAFGRIEQVQFLLEKWEDGAIGKILLKMFQRYWTPRNMNRYVRNAAIRTYSCESRLSLSDSIQHMLQLLFFEFLSYMVSWMNVDYSVDLILEDGNNSFVKDCFLKTLSVLPLPDISSLENNKLMAKFQKRRWNKFMFPFFDYVTTQLELVTSRCRQEIHIIEDQEQSYMLQNLEKKVVDLACKECPKILEAQDYNCITQIFASMLHSDAHCNSLWHCYLKDFICQCIIDTTDNHGQDGDEEKDRKVCISLLEKYFSPLKNESEMQRRMLKLHIHTAYNLLNLKRLMRTLLQVDESVQLSDVKQPNVQLMQVSRSLSYQYGELVHSIIHNLFSMLQSIPENNVASILSWSESYLNMVSIPTIKENLFQCASDRKVAFRFAVMHAIFLILQCVMNDLEKQAQVVFSLLHEVMEIEQSESETTFCDVIKICFEAIGKSDHFMVFVEGMLDHILRMGKCLIKDEETIWFLKLINSFDAEFPERHNSEPLTWPTKRFFLHKILGYYPEGVDMEDSISVGDGLPLFSPNERSIVGNLLSLSEDQLDVLYVPLCYQAQEFSTLNSIPNNAINQDLAHLYFEVVLQRLQEQKALTLSICIRAAEKITNALKSEQRQDKKLLLLIEKQALIQHTIQLLARDAQNQVQHMTSLRLVKKFDQLLKESMVEGHALSFAYNLLLSDKVRSTTKLVHILSNKEGLKKELTCLNCLDDFLPADDTSVAGFFPFVSGSSNSELSRLYQHVSEAMNDIHTSSGSNSEAFKDLCDKWCSSGEVISCDDIPGKLAFLACVWLSTFHNFFSMKKTSIILARYINDVLCKVGFDRTQIRIIACFLDQENFMVHIDEPALPAHFDPDLMDIEDFHEPGTEVDPLFSFFSNSSSDVNDRMLQQSVANLIAVVLCLPPRSNHLWFHLFEPTKLHDTYIIGYMYDQKMCHPYFYDCGVEVTEDGFPGKDEYDRVDEISFSLETEHLLLWANFSMLCISLLTQEDVELSGSVLTPALPARQYCVLKLKTAWLHMQTIMRFTVEKTSFFVMQCCLKIIKIGISSPKQLHGLINENDVWNEYERLWQEKVFATVKSDLDQQSFELHCQAELNTRILSLVRALEEKYPFFPTKLDLLSVFASNEALEQKYPVLLLFVQYYQKLQVGSEILSDLVEFYQWLHVDMGETLSYDEALSTTVISKVNEFAEKYADTVYLPEIYKRVQAGYNEYASAVSGAIGLGVCALENRKNRLYNLSDETIIYPLLSDEDEGWLFVVIENIVKVHNRVLKKLHDCACELQGKPSPVLQQREISLLEVNKAMCLVDSKDRFQQMVFRRGCMKFVGKKEHAMLSFDLSALQWDIIYNFLSGKSLIQDPKSSKFQFKQWKVTDYTSDALAHVSYLASLPKELKTPIDDGNPLIKELGVKFHSASFDQVMDIFSGMKNIGMHLIKQLENTSIQSDLLEGELLIKSFLQKFVFRNSHQLDVFEHIGMARLHDSQTDCLGNIPIKYIFGTVSELIKWIADGYYNYHMLPLSVKKPLDSSSQEVVLNLSQHEDYTGSLLKERVLDADLTELLEAFSIFEGHLKEHYGHMDLQAPILNLLLEWDVIREENSLLKNIPTTICVEHYVHFRIALSQMQKRREHLISKEHHFVVRELDKWKPQDVFNLWEVHFTHVSRTIKRVKASCIDADEQDSDDEDSGLHVVSDTALPSEDWTEKAEALTTEHIFQFLRSIKLESCLKAAEAAEVDGSLMAVAVTSEKDDMLKDIGIKRAHHIYKVRSNFSKFVQTCNSEL